MSSFIKQGKENLIKPITIVILIIIYTSALLFSEKLVFLCMLLFSFLLFFITRGSRVYKLIFCYVFLYVVSITLASQGGIDIVNWVGAIRTMLLILLKTFPLWVLAGILSTYRTTVLINSLKKTGLPYKICVAIAIFLRFIPEYRDYLNEIKEGLKVRGIRATILKPIFSIELYLVPMIYKAFETSEVLTGALVTKGIEYDCKKTSLVNLSLGIADYFVLLIGAIFTGITIWQKL